jgi:RND superfamily putative drug exporter
MTFVPAALALTRHAAWWLPKWLDRRLPDLDIEGDRLDHAHAAALPESAPLPRTGAGDAEGARASASPSTAD